MQNSGVCEPSTSLTLPYGDVDVDGLSSLADEISWQCVCDQGRYGDQCQYFSLNGACYNTTLESQNRNLGLVDSVETQCIWNAHLAQYEVLTQTNLPANLLAGASSTIVLCQGVVCTGQGTCSHVNENNDALEIFSNVNTDNTYNQALVTPQEIAFTAAVQSRVLAQVCTCNPGWSGQFCEIRGCLGGCGPGLCVIPTTSNDLRVPTSCSCPHSAYGPLLVDNSDGKCGGLVCAGRGTLSALTGSNNPTNDPTLYTCLCTPPHYQTSNLVVICGGVCTSPGIITQSPTAPGVYLCINPAITNQSSQAIVGGNKRLHLQHNNKLGKGVATPPPETYSSPSTRHGFHSTFSPSKLRTSGLATLNPVWARKAEPVSAGKTTITKLNKLSASKSKLDKSTSTDSIQQSSITTTNTNNNKDDSYYTTMILIIAISAIFIIYVVWVKLDYHQRHGE